MVFSDPPKRIIRLGMVGLGTVGSGVYRILKSHALDIEKKTGVRLALKRIAVRSLAKKRSVQIAASLLTRDAMSLAQDPEIDVLIEVAGGIHPAKEIIEAALASGKHVVTANKALLAEEGESLFPLADASHRKIGFEASVCGGIPIIKAVKEGLVSNRITGFLGIVNGTCNYILTQMSEGGADFKGALAQAQSQGYAEADPAMDISGTDSAHKLAVLARLSFGTVIPFKKIHVEGIGGICFEDITYARELGYAVKLLAIGKRRPAGLELRVHPTLLPIGHPLSSVRGVYNAVFIHADQAGDQLFYGRGAGMMPTASAILSDVVDIAKRIVSGGVSAGSVANPLVSEPVLPVEEVRSKYYLRFQASDRPGVLGMIAETLGKNQISILSVNQKESHATQSVPVIILTYEASEKNIRRALKAIDSRKEIAEKTTVIRVES